MKTYVAGHRGMVGGAILRRLEAEGRETITRTHAELDLTDQAAVRDFMQDQRPDQVILAAAKVGGILANNSYPAEFIYDNLIMEANVIHQAWAAGVQRLLFPSLGHDLSLADNLLVASVFTVLSLLRSFALRRLFQRLDRGGGS